MNEEILTSCRVRLMRYGELLRDFSCNDLDLDDYILNEADFCVKYIVGKKVLF